MPLDNYDKAIINLLGTVGPLNTNRIAEMLHISWETARRHCIRLWQWGYLLVSQIGNTKVWRLNN